MNQEELIALKKVISYLWDDEKKNWDELNRPDSHIFVSLLQLNGFYQKTIKEIK